MKQRKITTTRETDMVEVMVMVVTCRQLISKKRLLVVPTEESIAECMVAANFLNSTLSSTCRLLRSLRTSNHLQHQLKIQPLR